MKLKITVDAREYYFSHGRAPRGRGEWAFWMGRDSRDPLKASWFRGTYREALKQAVAHARGLGIDYVIVGP